MSREQRLETIKLAMQMAGDTGGEAVMDLAERLESFLGDGAPAPAPRVLMRGLSFNESAQRIIAILEKEPWLPASRVAERLESSGVYGGSTYARLTKMVRTKPPLLERRKTSNGYVYAKAQPAAITEQQLVNHISRCGPTTIKSLSTTWRVAEDDMRDSIISLVSRGLVREVGGAGSAASPFRYAAIRSA